MSAEYPIYRKSPGGKNYYRIDADDQFTERQLIGERVYEYKIVARQYPEMLLINALIEMQGYEESTAQEFDQLMAE